MDISYILALSRPIWSHCLMPTARGAGNDVNNRITISGMVKMEGNNWRDVRQEHRGL